MLSSSCNLPFAINIGIKSLSVNLLRMNRHKRSRRTFRLHPTKPSRINKNEGVKLEEDLIQISELNTTTVCKEQNINENWKIIPNFKVKDNERTMSTLPSSPLLDKSLQKLTFQNNLNQKQPKAEIQIFNSTRGKSMSTSLSSLTSEEQLSLPMTITDNTLPKDNSDSYVLRSRTKQKSTAHMNSVINKLSKIEGEVTHHDFKKIYFPRSRKATFADHVAFRKIENELFY